MAPNNIAGMLLVRFKAILGKLLALIAFCRRKRRVDVVESQYARLSMLSLLCEAIEELFKSCNNPVINTLETIAST